MNNFNTEVRYFILEYLKDKDRTGKFNPDNTKDDYDLIRSGHLSSLDYVELISALEEEFKIEIDIGDEDPGEFVKLSGLVSLVKKCKRN